VNGDEIEVLEFLYVYATWLILIYNEKNGRITKKSKNIFVFFKTIYLNL